MRRARTKAGRTAERGRRLPDEVVNGARLRFGLGLIDAGYPLHVAAQLSGIPRSTLHDHLRRAVPMTGDLHVILAEHRRQTQRIAGLVFGRSATQPFASSTANERAVRAWEAANAEATKRAEEVGRKLAPGELLVPIGLHEARHTYASFLIAAGVEMKAISTYMGHSSVAFTYDRYGHLLPDSLAENGAKLDASLARARAHGRARGV